jgi:hypothetical protein
MSLTGDAVAVLAIIAILTRLDLVFVGIYYILRSLRLTD